ncbi:hypothetical protein ACQKJC_11645 [Priestia koreensis]|uniref:hypothetical protein n=1 Tax=Priestia koreensis TaxID=284581 RepID=UPI003D035949
MTYSGDTVRLKCYFKTFNGEHIDPNDMKLTIYKADKTKIEEFEINDTHREKMGVYFYDYVTASELNEFIFEFAGSYNNKPILVRDLVKVKFI